MKMWWLHNRVQGSEHTVAEDDLAVFVTRGDHSIEAIDVEVTMMCSNDGAKWTRCHAEDCQRPHRTEGVLFL